MRGSIGRRVYLIDELVTRLRFLFVNKVPADEVGPTSVGIILVEVTTNLFQKLTNKYTAFKEYSSELGVVYKITGPDQWTKSSRLQGRRRCVSNSAEVPSFERTLVTSRSIEMLSMYSPAPDRWAILAHVA